MAIAAGNTVSTGGKKQPDPALCNSVQVHYVADPDHRRRPRPSATAHGWLLGERDEVAIPDLSHIDHKKIQLDRAVASGFSASQATSVEAALATIGDGGGLSGFHDAILHASWAYAKITPPRKRSLKDIKARIIEAVRAAPRADSRSDGEIDRYLSDTFLDTIIRGAFDKLPHVTDGWTPHPPTYPMPTQSDEEHRREMRAAIRKFIDSPHDADSNPLQGLIKSELGSGKSQATADILAEVIPALKAGERPWRFVVGVPEHSLGAELAKRYQDRGVEAAVWWGREYEPEPDKPLCNDLYSVRSAISAAADVEKAVCDNGDRQCPYYSMCQYQQQKPVADKADVVLVSHELLRRRGLPSQISHDVAMIIIEEGFIGDPPVISITVETLSADIKDSPCWMTRTRIINNPDGTTEKQHYEWMDFEVHRKAGKATRQIPQELRRISDRRQSCQTYGV